MIKVDVAIMILSCDKFNVTWKPCIDHFFNAWPNCPHPIYLLNNFLSSNDNRVEDLMVGEDLNWSDSLKKGLLKIHEKRVFFIYDDSFITNIDLAEINSIFEICSEKDLDSVIFRKKSYGSSTCFDEKLFKIKSTAKYRNSLFLNLIKRDLLLDLLKSGENAWQFEKQGNSRSENFDFYSVYSNHLVSYKHGIVKGKWLPNTYKYLKYKGYDLDGDPFDKHSLARLLAIKIYISLFNFLHATSHVFKK